ncbi:hypothetical protein BGX38DRAFT_1094437 [Terfezia claveryi]|nr:hypothetical protein BGX38DRAFT_1094437 [Terfezia claveryi]
MHTLPFLTLDVFTDTRYLGNPLGVVRIPHGHPSPPTQEQKQKIAKEFNLSETIFLHENPETPTDTEEEVVKIDIFTIDQELPFAGHPTVGAGYYLHTLRGSRAKRLALMTKAGKIPVRALPGNIAALEVPHNVHLHKAEMVSTEMMALFPTVSHDDYHGELPCMPVFSIVKGMTFILPRLASVEALGRVTPSPSLATPSLDAPWDQGLVGFFFFVVVEREAVGDMWVWRLRTRMILGLLEDPATGSASCALSAYLALTDGAKRGVLKHKFQLTQGVEMGRTSTVGVEIVLKEGGKDLESLLMSGTAVKVLEGTLGL